MLDSDIIPDLRAFQELDFPLRQTVKVHLTTRQSPNTDSSKTNKTADSKNSTSSQPALSSSQSLSKLYGFNTLPLMESAIGIDSAKAMLDQIVADEEAGQDVGCICEIDLSKSKKIAKIMSRLLYPPKSNKKD